MSELKAFVEFLGFDPEKIKTVDDFKSEFEKEFVRTKNVIKGDHPELTSGAVGKRLGDLTTAAKRLAKEYGLDLTPEEANAKSIEDVYSRLLSKSAEKHLSVVTELEKKVGQTNDEAIKEWKEKYEKTHKSLGEKEALLGETVNKYQELEKTSSTKIKEIGISSKKSEILRELMPSLNLGDDTLKIKGWESLVNSFEYDTNDSGELEIRSEGKPIPNPKVTGSYMKPLEVLTEAAIKANVYKLNQQGGTVVKQVNPQAPTPQPNKEAKPVLMNKNLASQRV